jgi:hypothetical protein
VSFLSKFIADAVIKACTSEVQKELRNFALTHHDAESAKFRGNIVEHFIHPLIPGNFGSTIMKSLSLTSYPSLPPPLQTSTEAKTIRFRELADILLELGSPTYCIPVINNQGASEETSTRPCNTHRTRNN